MCQMTIRWEADITRALRLSPYRFEHLRDLVLRGLGVREALEFLGESDPRKQPTRNGIALFTPEELAEFRAFDEQVEREFPEKKPRRYKARKEAGK